MMSSMDELLSFKHLALKSSHSDDEASQPNTATTSQNTTPGETPIGTPATQRKGSTVMKLNINDSTWHIDKVRKRKGAKGADPDDTPRKPKKVSFLRSIPRRLENPDTRFRVVLGVLMSSILSIVFLTHHLHRALEDSKHVKMGIRLDERDLYIHHNWRGMLLHGKLANSLSTALMAHTCKTGKPGFCKEWKFRARLEIYLDYRENNVTCYNIVWKKMGHSDMEDTYNLRNAEWYGMGEVTNLFWPSRGFQVDYIKFATGQAPLGTIIKPYWLSSKGVGILVHKKEQDKLLFSFNSTGDNQLLLYTTDNVLNYTICKGETAFDVHMSFFPNLSRKTGDPSSAVNATKTTTAPLPQDSKQQNVPSLLEGNSTTALFLKRAILAPQVDTVEHFNQSMISAFAEKFKSDQGIIQGHFLILQHWWQRSSGDLDFNPERFPKPAEMVKQLHKNEMKVMLEVDPYMCLNSTNFDSVSKSEVLIHDENNVPLFTRWKGQLCSPIDLYNVNSAVKWFLEKLHNLKKVYGIDGFVFQGGQSSTLPYHYVNTKGRSYLHQYLYVVGNVSEYVGSPGGDKGFVSLGTQPPTWEALKSLPAKVMMIGLFGNNIINPGCVGGDLVMGGSIEDTELYVRWWQFAVFMPVLQVCRVPNEAIAGDFVVVKTIRKLVNLREKKILKVIEKSLTEEPNFPVVRPIWALDPKNDNCYKFPNQFAVGNDMIVAPILEPKVNETLVYLPFGTWCEDQKVHQGESTITVKAELDTAIYFFRCNKTVS